LRIGGLEEFDHRIAGAVDLAAHAAAHVENHAERNRRILAGEGFDFLRFPAFEKIEILTVQAGDEPVHGIGDGDRHQDQIHIDFVGLSMRAQGGIALWLRGRRGLNPGPNVDVFG
jgi:hypothetical protein